MNKRTVSGLVKAIEKQKKRIANERDKLSDLVNEAQSIVDNCDDAMTNLEYAVDTLSEYL